MKTVLGVAIAVLFVSAPAWAQRPDFLQWRQDDCRKIVQNHLKFAGPSKTTAVLSPRDRFRTIRIAWLTDTAIKALTRLQQLSEHLSDGEALTAYAMLRAQTHDYYWFLLPDVADTRFNQQIIIVNKKAPGRQRLAHGRLRRPLEIGINRTLQAFGFISYYFVACDKISESGKPMIDSLTDEIQVRISGDSGWGFQTTFKLKKLVLSLNDL